MPQTSHASEPDSCSLVRCRTLEIHKIDRCLVPRLGINASLRHCKPQHAPVRFPYASCSPHSRHGRPEMSPSTCAGHSIAGFGGPDLLRLSITQFNNRLENRRLALRQRNTEKLTVYYGPAEVNANFSEKDSSYTLA